MLGRSPSSLLIAVLFILIIADMHLVKFTALSTKFDVTAEILYLPQVAVVRQRVDQLRAHL